MNRTKPLNTYPLLHIKKNQFSHLPIMSRCFRCSHNGDLSIKPITLTVDIPNSADKTPKNICNNCASSLLKRYKATMSPLDGLASKANILLPLVNDIFLCRDKARHAKQVSRIAQILYIICEYNDGIHKSELKKVLSELGFVITRDDFSNYLLRLKSKQLIGITQNEGQSGIIVPSATSLNLFTYANFDFLPQG